MFEGNPNEKPADTRARVDGLRKSDGLHEDSVEELAHEHDEYRTALLEAGTPRDAVEGHLADRHSDVKLAELERGKESSTDVLTGYKNKRALLEGVPQLLSLDRRQESASAFLMIDFDDFKSINDTYGHLEGDAALKKVADVIKNSLRSSDILYRYGGDEFAVFLPNTTSEQAGTVAEKVRENVSAMPITVNDQKENPVELSRTVSIGYIGTDQREDLATMDPEKILSLVDAALYASKQDGENQLTLFSPETEGGTSTQPEE